jgi:2,3-diketo-5-methylthio-1-phosphopentane phosphatase
MFCSVVEDFNQKIAAFDFDYTLINANSFNYLNRLVIEREKTLSKHQTPSIANLNQFKYSPDIENLKNKSDNTVRMNAIFEYMHTEHHITQKDMVECLSKNIKISESIKNLIEKLALKKDYDFIIISDSIKFLIRAVLNANNLGCFFDDNKIFANDSTLNTETGILKVIPYNQSQNLSIFECSDSLYCRKNICKGSVLERYVKDKNVNEVIYVGDGTIGYSLKDF